MKIKQVNIYSESTQLRILTIKKHTTNTKYYGLFN